MIKKVCKKTARFVGLSALLWEDHEFEKFVNKATDETQGVKYVASLDVDFWQFSSKRGPTSSTSTLHSC